MKKYFKHFAWLYIVFAITLIAFIGVMVTKGKKEQISYTRTNTECLNDGRVFDYADKLSDSQETELSAYIAEKEDEIGCDIIFMTVDEDVSSMMVYADDFYDNNKYGYDKPWGDGAVFAANFTTGEAWFSTCGRVEYTYSVSMIDRMTEKVCEYLRSDTNKAAYIYVNQLVADMQNQSNFTSDIPYHLYIVIFAAIATVIYIVINLIHSKGKRTTVANTYVVGGKPFMRSNQDIFLHKHVTKRRIESSSGGGHSGGGGHHVSSGGHSHGGGGRSF